MTRQELELKAKEFDSKLKRHPMSSEELQNVLCDFVEALRIHDVVVRSEQLPYSIYEEELNKMKQLPQTQTSLMKQREVLRIFANKLGLYDAADFLRNDR